MKVENETQQRYLDLVERCLRGSFGDRVQPASASPSFAIALKQPVMVRVSALTETDVVIDVATWVAHGIEITPEVAALLLERSAAARFGKIGVDRDGDIVVEHSLFPECLDCAVLVRLVELISHNAAELTAALTSGARD